jgi:hypothetical protein
MVKKISIFNFQFSKTAKITFVLLALGFLAVGCDKTSNQQTANQPISNQQSAINKSEDKTKPQNEPMMISVTQSVEGLSQGGEEANYSVAKGSNALVLLKMGVKNVETKTFSGVGEYVVAINGLTETTGKNFWAFYVNGKQAKVGAGDYVLQEGDKVEWKLEAIK